MRWRTVSARLVRTIGKRAGHHPRGVGMGEEGELLVEGERYHQLSLQTWTEGRHLPRTETQEP